MRKKVRFVLVTILMIMSITLYGDTNKQQKYIVDNLELARESVEGTGIPVSITLAQGILESDSGGSSVTKRTNNHFGLRKRDKKGKYYYVSFKNKRESYFEHTKRLKQKRYSECYKSDRYDDWAYNLRDCGYCPYEDYPSQLIRIIERYNLDKYDKEEVEEDTKQTSLSIILNNLCNYQYNWWEQICV